MSVESAYLNLSCGRVFYMFYFRESGITVSPSQNTDIALYRQLVTCSRHETSLFVDKTDVCHCDVIISMLFYLHICGRTGCFQKFACYFVPVSVSDGFQFARMINGCP